MALTLNHVQVTWPTGANSKSVAANTDETSEEYNLNATCIAARITLKADNSTTPASDDVIHFFLIETTGDPDADPESADEFGTAGHSLRLASLDTNAEDPALITVQLPVPQKGFKIIARGTVEGTTNAITVSAQVTELRFA